MSNEIIIASISLIGTTIGTAIGSFSGFKLIAYRVQQLEKKGDRQTAVTERIPVIEERINVINHRINDIEKKVGI